MLFFLSCFPGKICSLFSVYITVCPSAFRSLRLVNYILSIFAERMKLIYSKEIVLNAIEIEFLLRIADKRTGFSCRNTNRTSVILCSCSRSSLTSCNLSPVLGRVLGLPVSLKLLS